MTEYKTVEGHVIERDRDYEALDGRIFKVIYIPSKSNSHCHIAMMNMDYVYDKKEGGGELIYTKAYDKVCTFLIRPYSEKIKETEREFRDEFTPKSKTRQYDYPFGRYKKLSLLEYAGKGFVFCENKEKGIGYQLLKIISDYLEQQ